jgi:hypothetical protein
MDARFNVVPHQLVRNYILIAAPRRGLLSGVGRFFCQALKRFGLELPVFL